MQLLNKITAHHVMTDAHRDSRLTALHKCLLFIATKQTTEKQLKTLCNLNVLCEKIKGFVKRQIHILTRYVA